MGHEETSSSDSAFVDVFGGGFGEPPVRVADLEAAARKRSAARRVQATADDDDPQDVEDYAQLGEN